ncbi:uncharacterized protein LOC119017299 isoform X2 [Acanthopagrus latus]|uniref:uncharacterized protein LOC119017299 isoform X2 n=1 Tax=Acanthopagrus latus TaxID=8177 RepID=UPI00187CBE7D|nr:uncharacterized protein LOC119017299 isoform X2 [Acanthopagrus latus]
MSKVQTLRVFVKQRLTAAAEEIFELFERTIAEYEEELCRQSRLLQDAGKSDIQNKAGFPANVKKFLENKEEDPPEQQEWSSSLDQEDSPELSHIKEEQEELWTRKEGEQLRRLEEADIKFTFTPVPAKRDGNDEEEPQSSELHQRQTAEMRDDADCGGSEPVRDFGRRHLQAAGLKTSHSNDGVKQSGESQSKTTSVLTAAGEGGELELDRNQQRQYNSNILLRCSATSSPSQSSYLCSEDE